MKNIEIIVVIKNSAPTSSNVASILSKKSINEDFIMTLKPLFNGSQPVLSCNNQAITGMSEMYRYFVGFAPENISNTIINELTRLPQIESAYAKPQAENPVATIDIKDIANPIEASNIPDFTSQQGYLGNAPSGVDARYAWQFEGGSGSNIRIIDIEGGWQLTHFDLIQNNNGLVGGEQYDGVDWRNHGTAVFAEIGADANDFGVTGIAPDAVLSACSHGSIGSAMAIKLAADQLQHGDVILLEMHRPGPRYNYQFRTDQLGYICVEWWPDDLLAIQYATSKGIIVVEAAGNGAEDLDDKLYNKLGAGFPENWKNPLVDPALSDAIVVGAGAPPLGFYGTDLSRLAFSNYGQRIDCQGWGRGVVTAGYGDLFRCSEAPSDENYWYTDKFSGTSSAAPMIAGVVACLQGIAKQRGSMLTTQQIRNALRTTGSKQPPDELERIGSRPDLRQLLAALFP